METGEMRALSRRAAAFTQAEVSRAIRAAEKAGGNKWAIEIERDGMIRLVPHEGQRGKAAGIGSNQDYVL
jgi:hypothetical protein